MRIICSQEQLAPVLHTLSTMTRRETLPLYHRRKRGWSKGRPHQRHNQSTHERPKEQIWEDDF